MLHSKIMLPSDGSHEAAFFDMGSQVHNMLRIVCGLSRENSVSRFLTIKVDVVLFLFQRW